MAISITGLLVGDRPRDVVRRSVIISIVSFLTLIDLFGAQALLPQIIVAFRSDPGTAGFAVNAATLGMAVSGMTVAWFADRIDRKRGIWVCLALLSIPTALLSITHSIWIFMALRVIQGALMAAAFTLTATYLSERCDMTAKGGALAAYITGNVASNLFGRLTAVTLSDVTSLSGSFLFFAGLNLVGAAFALILIGPRDDVPPMRADSALDAWKRHFSNPALRAVFGIGFFILFIFVGVFTYVNLYLVNQLHLSPMSLGLAYLVFAPAIITTPMAGNLVRKFGPRTALTLSLGVALASLTLTLSSELWVVLTGLALLGMATFSAQAAATGYVSANVSSDRAQANGLYLTSYYLGGLVGALLLGQVNAHFGWPATVLGVGAATVAAIGLARSLGR
jgi:MFS transporter, YNFM family, putative membrane transport protein